MNCCGMVKGDRKSDFLSLDDDICEVFRFLRKVFDTKSLLFFFFCFARKSEHLSFNVYFNLFSITNQASNMFKKILEKFSHNFFFFSSFIYDFPSFPSSL